MASPERIGFQIKSLLRATKETRGIFGWLSQLEEETLDPQLAFCLKHGRQSESLLAYSALCQERLPPTKKELPLFLLLYKTFSLQDNEMDRLPQGTPAQRLRRAIWDPEKENEIFQFRKVFRRVVETLNQSDLPRGPRRYIKERLAFAYRSWTKIEAEIKRLGPEAGFEKARRYREETTGQIARALTALLNGKDCLLPKAKRTEEGMFFWALNTQIIGDVLDFPPDLEKRALTFVTGALADNQELEGVKRFLERYPKIPPIIALRAEAPASLKQILTQFEDYTHRLEKYPNGEYLAFYLKTTLRIYPFLYPLLRFLTERFGRPSSLTVESETLKGKREPKSLAACLREVIAIIQEKEVDPQAVLVLLDIDGVLRRLFKDGLPPNLPGAIPPKSKKLLWALQEMGIKIGFVTNQNLNGHFLSRNRMLRELFEILGVQFSSVEEAQENGVLIFAGDWRFFLLPNLRFKRKGSSPALIAKRIGETYPDVVRVFYIGDNPREDRVLAGGLERELGEMGVDFYFIQKPPGLLVRKLGSLHP